MGTGPVGFCRRGQPARIHSMRSFPPKLDEEHMDRQPIYAWGLSSGLSLASLLEALRAINWTSVLMFTANCCVSYYTFRRARVQVQREEAALVREREEAELRRRAA